MATTTHTLFWSQQGNGTALSAATLQKCLLVFLPSGPDPVSTETRKTLIFPFLSPLTSFLPLVLQKCCMVLQGTLLPVMPAVGGWCACAPGAWGAGSSLIAGLLPKMTTMERSSMSAGSTEVCLPGGLKKHLAPEHLPPEPDIG